MAQAKTEPGWRLDGKTCLVTGATNGIGKVAALELARLGADVVVVARSRDRGEAAAREIRERSGRPRVDLLLCDFASQEEIRKLARDYLASGRPLHVLLNNAGLVNTTRRETVDGLEETFAVNHLGYFLLTNLLLERLRQSAPARIVNVASDAHRFARRGLDFDDLQNRRGYSAMRVYAESKLANILFTRELARRLEGSGVTVNALHPGAVGTGLALNNGWLARLLVTLYRPLALTPEQGAETSIYLCASPEVEGKSGLYFYRSREHRPNRFGADDEAARRLWSASERLVGLA
jgi:NAD(P)-dependent dehydrogenase (short-subunit alcohol dehydrogenase family)